MERLPNSYIPAELSQSLREVGRQWAASHLRPRIDSNTIIHWERLVTAWSDSDLPLIIRKSEGMRGNLVIHNSGRRLILADNSPAQWAFSRAYSGECYSLSQIKSFLEINLIPFTLVKAKEEDKVDYNCALSKADCVNNFGWKLCHLNAIGLNNKTKSANVHIDLLKQHFCSFLMPSNHFLVPKTWAAMGEVPEIIDEIRKIDRQM